MLTGVGAFVLVWSFASELVSAFQCGVTETWKPFGNKCIDRVSHHHGWALILQMATADGASDIILDLLRSA